MQFHRFAGDPGRSGTDTGTAMGTKAGEAMPVDCAVSLVNAQRQCRLGPTERVTGASGIDPDPGPGRAGIKVLDHHERPAFSRVADQRAPLLLLNHVVGAKAVAHVPGHDLFAGTELPGAGAVRRIELIDPGPALRGATFRALLLQGEHTGQAMAAGAQFGLQ